MNEPTKSTAPLMSEDAALALLENRSTTPEEIEDIAKISGLLASRKVMLAIARHIHTPRRISIPLIRQLFVFELMQVALTPAVAADIKLLAEQCLVGKLSSVSLGERLTLAKRGSTRVAAALLTDPDVRVRDAAMNNPFMTEIWIVRALMKPGVPAAFKEAIRRHPKWSCRGEVRRVLEGGNAPASKRKSKPTEE